MAMCYAGIGSRDTPPIVALEMTQLAEELALEGWHLSSGGADGADSAFADGALRSGARRIWIPWNGYNGMRRGAGVVDCQTHPQRWRMETVAAKAMTGGRGSGLGGLSRGVKALFVRNAFVIAAGAFDRPVDAVVCWNPVGKERGGTAHALRIARDLPEGSPLVINLAEQSVEQTLDQLKGVTRQGDRARRESPRTERDAEPHVQSRTGRPGSQWSR